MALAKKVQELTQDDFGRLIRWLDPDPERAGIIYEKVRWRLIAILAARGCSIPEELADEVINRVSRRVVDIQDTYTGDKSIYFLGVMNNVHHEYLKRPKMTGPPSVDITDAANTEDTHRCLDTCLGKLAPFSRILIERYYSEDKRRKIDLRKRVAAQLGISVGTLRLRALRIRQKLQVCIEQCLEQ